MKHRPSCPPPPDHLGDRGRQLWQDIAVEYGIADAGGLALLRAACESADRAESARLAIEADGGVTVRDRFGQPKVHPAAAVERDALRSLVAALKALQLDVEPIKGIGRPTSPVGVMEV